jgi:hypothetical protein
MSSTSHEVCELFNGKGIVRAMGNAKIKQILIFPDEYSQMEKTYHDEDERIMRLTRETAREQNVRVKDSQELKESWSREEKRNELPQFTGGIHTLSTACGFNPSTARDRRRFPGATKIMYGQGKWTLKDL